MIRSIEISKDFVLKEFFDISCTHIDIYSSDFVKDVNFIQCCYCGESQTRTDIIKFEDLDNYFLFKKSFTGGYFFSKLLTFILKNTVKFEVSTNGTPNRYAFCMWLDEKTSVSTRASETFEDQLIWCAGFLFYRLTLDYGKSKEEVRKMINGK